jgi:hypothetical protein
MKKLFALLLLITGTIFCSYGQVPQGFKYQTVLRKGNSYWQINW